MSLPGPIGTPEWLTLERDEQVRVHVRPSKNLLLVTVAIGTVFFVSLGVVGILFTVDVGVARFVSLVILLFLFVVTGGVYLLTRQREYVVTSHRVCAAVGLTSKEITAVDVADVREVTVQQSNWQSLINVGDLRFVIDGENAVRFALVENPEWIYERALESVEIANDLRD